MKLFRLVVVFAFLGIVGLPHLPYTRAAETASPDVASTYANVQEITTPLGIKVWFVKNTQTPAIVMRFLFKHAGSAADPDNQYGVGNLAVDMLGEGAGPYDKEALSAHLQDHGISLSLDINQDTIEGSLVTLKRYQKTAFETLKTVLLEPHFKTENFRRLRRKYLVSLENSLKQPFSVGSRTLKKVLFGHHPYGRTADLQLKTLPSLTVEDLRTVLARMGRDNLMVVVVGNTSAAAVKTLVDQTFGDLPEQAKVSPLKEAVISARGETLIQEKEIPQSLVLFAQTGLTPKDPDFLKCHVLMQILGAGATSRLTREIREKRGLVYTVQAGLNDQAAGGTIIGTLGTKNESAVEAVSVVKQEWGRMQKNGPTEQELEDAKSYLIGSFPLNLTNSPAIASVLLSFQYRGYAPTYLQSRAAQINAITVGDLRAVARKRLDPQKLHFVIVGRTL